MLKIIKHKICALFFISLCVSCFTKNRSQKLSVDNPQNKTKKSDEFISISKALKKECSKLQTDHDSIKSACTRVKNTPVIEIANRLKNPDYCNLGKEVQRLETLLSNQKKTAPSNDQSFQLAEIEERPLFVGGLALLGLAAVGKVYEVKNEILKEIKFQKFKQFPPEDIKEMVKALRNSIPMMKKSYINAYKQLSGTYKNAPFVKDGKYVRPEELKVSEKLTQDAIIKYEAQFNTLGLNIRAKEKPRVLEVKNLETLYRDTVKQESFDFKMREHYKNPDVNPGYSAKSDQPRAKVPIKSLFVTGLLTTAASFAHRDGGITDSGLLLSETRSTDALLVFTKLEKRLRKLHNCTGT